MLVEKKSLPLILHIQMDNYLKGNKCRYAFYFWSLLVANAILEEVYISFMMVGYTHDNIDT